MFLRYALDVISIAILGNLIFVFLPLSPLLVLRGKFFVRWHLYAFLKYIKAFSLCLSKQSEVHTTIASMFNEVRLSGEIIGFTMFKDK